MQPRIKENKQCVTRTKVFPLPFSTEISLKCLAPVSLHITLNRMNGAKVLLPRSNYRCDDALALEKLSPLPLSINTTVLLPTSPHKRKQLVTFITYSAKELTGEFRMENDSLFHRPQGAVVVFQVVSRGDEWDIISHTKRPQDTPLLSMHAHWYRMNSFYIQLGHSN